MANPQINVSSLDFDEIKSSLKQYLSNQQQFNSFDFNGSGINLLLNIFAYNTLYYAYYANMIANEMFLETAQIENNFASLLKPLGVLLPGRSCSVGTITAKMSNATGTITGYTDYFVGTTNTGITYRFYTISNIDLSDTATSFNVYEAKDVAKDIILNVDTTTQTAYISNSAIDINTIRIKVNDEEWTLYQNSSQSIGPNGKVYFIDRTAAGFYIVFGKRTINDFSNNYGKTINSADEVKISYLVPSGSSANGTFRYSPPAISGGTITITDNGPSSDGGRETPDLDLYRYSAPKIFAANDRAITKDDYIGLLFNSGLLPSDITSKEEINVWGGEEAVPPSFGRVFISFANEGITGGNFAVKNCLALLKRKAPVTITPEYSQAQIMTANIDINAVGASDVATLKTAINEYYNSNLKFNNFILIGDIKNIIITKQPNIIGVNLNSISLGLDILGSASSKKLFYKNQLFSPTNGSNYQTITSSQFTYNGETVFLGDTPTGFNSAGEAVRGVIYPYKASNNFKSGTKSVGTIDYTNGVVVIDPNVLPTTTKTTITAIPRYPETVSFVNEILLKVNTTINGA